MAANSSDVETMKSIIIGHNLFFCKKNSVNIIVATLPICTFWLPGVSLHGDLLSLKEATIEIFVQNNILDWGALKVKEVAEHYLFSKVLSSKHQDTNITNNKPLTQMHIKHEPHLFYAAVLVYYGLCSYRWYLQKLRFDNKDSSLDTDT